MKKWIGYITNQNFDFTNQEQDYGIPSSYIIKDFYLASTNKVTITIAVLGVYSLFVNGSLINDSFMESDVTELTKRVYSRTYDISKFVFNGKNRLGVILGDGWYASNLSIVHKNVFGNYPLKTYFTIKCGGREVAYSNGDELAKDGSIRASDNQNGMIIDNNYFIENFSSLDMNLDGFKKVECFDIDVVIENDPLPQIIKHEIFKPKIILKKDNYVIYDFGQNMAGVIHALFKGNKNDYVEIYHSEVLNGDDIYLENLRTAKAKDTFILSGKEREEFLPRFTFHGFRYIKVVAHGDIKTILIEAYALYTNLERVGYIETNNKLVNQIYSNIIWGQKSNFFSIPTDCPQRDERMGWTGDAQIFSMTGCYNFESNSFYKSYLQSVRDSMDLYSDVVPAFVPNFFRKTGFMTGGPGWSDAIIIIPYNLYLFYGDKSILEDNFAYMKRYLLYIEKNCMNQEGMYSGHSFGDWLSVIETTDIDFYSNSYIAYDYLLLSKICSILGKEESDLYKEKYNTLKDKIINKFISKDKKVANDSQGAYVLAVALGICDPNEITNNLIRKINDFGHLTTGFHSTKYLLPLLCDIGESRLAYKLLNQTSYPSWGYMVESGATTIWERWDSFRRDIGFNKDGMNSFNHYSLGSVGEWMYAYMAGIKPIIDSPGFKKTIVKPYFDKSISSLKLKFNSPSGKIDVEYNISGNMIEYYISADKNIELIFDFINKTISKEKLGNNMFRFKLKY